VQCDKLWALLRSAAEMGVSQATWPRRSRRCSGCSISSDGDGADDVAAQRDARARGRSEGTT
jgi:hypothetical protein